MKTDERSELAERVYRFRKYVKLNQTQFAKKLGVTQGAISNWETGIDNPSSKALFAISKDVPERERQWWRDRAAEQPGIDLADVEFVSPSPVGTPANSTTRILDTLSELTEFLHAATEHLSHNHGAQTVSKKPPERIQPQVTDSGLNESLPLEVKRALAFGGIFSRVADQMGLSKGHVLQAAKGQRPSRRVIDPIVHEVKRIERETSSHQKKEKAA